MLVMKNNAARAAVARDKKEDDPRAPNTVADAPLPNAAPASAPRPCCISTRPTRPIAKKRWNTVSMVCIARQERVTSAAVQIARKSDALREAPPMRPPSMSGLATSSPALSGFMLPP